jgi:hypothetical protein
VEKEKEDVGDKLKRWVGYMPEVRLGKAIARWVKSKRQPDSAATERR